jgi:hypothetical protein
MARKLHGLKEIRLGIFSTQRIYHVNRELLTHFALKIAWGFLFECLNYLLFFPHIRI